MRHVLTACAVLLALSHIPAGAAQNAAPWQIPGTEAGEEITGPDGGVMVWVPAGELLMGSDDGAADETPVHQVRISKGFWLSKHEITVAQWKQYCKDARVALEVHIFAETDDYPMMGVNWADAQAYCRFYGLAMPTEAQWEYAARGPEARRYPWGDDWDQWLCCNDENVGPQAATCPVGSFPDGASWCGALDMAGNMAEWCQDWYAPEYYAEAPQDDPQGPDTGTERVQRGGYFWGDANDCRSATRSSDDPGNRDGAGCLRACWTP